MHASFMAGYYLLTGFIITEMEDVSPFSIILLTIAMVFHFQSMDFIIYKKYHAVYEKFVRWIFAFATLIGWIIAEATEANQLILALFFYDLSTLTNSIKPFGNLPTFLINLLLSIALI